MFTMGGMWCSVVVAERGGSSSPFVGGVVDHCQRWWGGGGLSWLLMMGCCSPFMRVLVSHGGGPLLAGHPWRWWGVALAILGLIGGGGGSSLLVALPCVAACNRRHCVQSSSCHSRVFITCGRRLLSS